MIEKVAEKLKNKVSRIYAIWIAVFIVLFLGVTAIGLFLKWIDLSV